MVLISVMFTFALTSTSEPSSFFRFGPHPDFVIMGVRIDNGARYAAAVTYCFANSVFRTVHHSVVTSWIINNVQDEERDKSSLLHAAVYEVVAVSTVYAWWDWVIYIFILMSQVDMVLVEVSAELLVALLTTHAYLRTGPVLGLGTPLLLP
jgi:hypothetical protein